MQKIIQLFSLFTIYLIFSSCQHQSKKEGDVQGFSSDEKYQKEFQE